MTHAAQNITPIVSGREVIQLSEEDAQLVREAYGEMIGVQALLGEEYYRHLRACEELRRRLETKQQEAEALTGALSRKYIQKKGQYTLEPNLGAFVGFAQPEPEEGEQ